ncbi:unnamed protein product, partial [marine sediment metagenome]
MSGKYLDINAMDREILSHVYTNIGLCKFYALEQFKIHGKGSIMIHGRSWSYLANNLLNLEHENPHSDCLRMSYVPLNSMSG